MPAKPFLGLGVDWASDTIKCALLDSSHTPSTSQVYWADVSADECSGTGYTAGGLTLTAPVWSATGNMCYLNAENAVWDPVDLTSASYLYVYKDTGTASISPLIGYYQFTTATVSGGRAEFQIGANGYVQGRVTL